MPDQTRRGSRDPRRCEHLERWAHDPELPFHYDPARRCYAVDVAPGVTILPARCVYCGGYGDPGQGTSQPPCTCGGPDQWAGTPASIVEYDGQLNEYRLKCTMQTLIMYFCPSCGGRMPLSKRGALFTEPVSEEMAAIEERLKGVSNVGEVIARLGEPDERLDFADVMTGGTRAIRRQLVYRSLAVNVEVYIQEDSMGTLAVYFGGKPRRP